MTDGVLIFWLLAFGFFQRGLTAVVLTQETVMAAVGGEAHLSCQLRETRNVLQVTWKKILLDEDKNIATFSQIVGQRVNSGFTDKVEFKDPELQKNSIVIRNITEEDEGCYLCMFNTPDGPLTAATCIQLYELHEPVLHVRESNSSAESVVSCSATGRPAPTVTLTVTQQHLDFLHHNTVSVSNTNGTVTVTATAVLSRFCNNSIQVGCAAGVLSGPRMEAFVMIPELKPTSDDDAESGSDHTRFRLFWIPLLSMFCGCVAVVIVIVFRNKDQNRNHHINDNPETATQDISNDLEMNENPEPATRSPHQTLKSEEHFGPHENIELRQRSPQKGNRENEDCNQSFNAC